MREIFNLPSMDEGGNDYVQTLNYIVASDAQEYQIGKKIMIKELMKMGTKRKEIIKREKQIRSMPVSISKKK